MQGRTEKWREGEGGIIFDLEYSNQARFFMPKSREQNQILDYWERGGGQWACRSCEHMNQRLQTRGKGGVVENEIF